MVYESTPVREYEEAMVKARVLARRRRPVTLLETMRWEPDRGIWLRDRHLSRLRSSARYLGVTLQEVAISDLMDGLAGDEPLVVRLLVSDDGSASLEALPLVDGPPVVGLAVDDRPIDRSDYLRYHKTTRRAVYEQAAARHPDADDVVLVNELGEAVETTIANLVARRDGVWVTPPIASGCLPGTYREDLLDRGVLVEQPLPVADLLAADEVAVINSVRGWRSAELPVTGRSGG